jgi:hypothetical protein
LHPILAVLVDEKHGEDQVEWESRALAGDLWRVCMGPMLLLKAPPSQLATSAFLDRLLDAWASTTPTREVHWIRWFVMVNKTGRLGSEVLLDNEPWPEGERLLADWSLPETDDLYSARLFMLLVPPNR